MQKPALTRQHLFMLIAPFFWALGHPLGRIILKSVHPFQLGSVTLCIGFLGLLLFLVVSGKIREIRKLEKKDFLFSLGLGVFGFFLYQILTFSALARIPASMNAVLVSTNVVFIALLAAVLLGERLSFPKLIGIFTALAGVVLVTFNRGFSVEGFSLIGCGLSILAALSFSIYSVLGKKLLVRGDPLIIAASALLSGSVLLAILTASTVGFRGTFESPPLTLLMVLLGLTMIAVAYPLWFACLKKLPVSHISIYIYLTPVFAVLLSIALLKESFAWIFWIGFVLVLAGIMMTNMIKPGKK